MGADTADAASDVRLTDAAPAPDAPPMVMVPPTAVPAPWKNADIGMVGLEGAAGSDAPTYYVRGAGADIWSTADAFNYLYRPVSGDLEIITKVVSTERPHSDAKAGVMFRESLLPEARNVAMLIYPSMSKGSRLQYRDNRVDDVTHYVDLEPGPHTAPIWLKLERRGNLFIGSFSLDGTNWVKDGQVTMALPNDLLVGLAVTSHTVTDTNTTAFEGVRLTHLAPPSNPDQAWRHTEVGSVGGYASGDPAQLKLESAGSGFVGNADGLTFVHQGMQVIGDVEVVARVTALASTEAGAKVGLALRSTLAPSSRIVAVTVQTDGTVAQLRRTSDTGNVGEAPRLDGSPDGGAAGGDGGAGAFKPVWLKLVRIGNRFASFMSTDGAAWVTVADESGLNVSDNTFVGVGIGSGNTLVPASATITDLRVVVPPTTSLPALDGGVPDGAAGQ